MCAVTCTLREKLSNDNYWRKKMATMLKCEISSNSFLDPWYIRNNDLHRDLQVDVVSRELQKVAQKHERRLHQHENVEAIQLLDNVGIVRRLQRKKTFSASLSDSARVKAELVPV
jgi:hypothetical protein